MTPAQFCKLGAALRGPSWQRAIALDLGVYERTVRRYVSGESPIPDAIEAAVVKLLRDHAKLLVALARAYRMKDEPKPQAAVTPRIRGRQAR
jgi:hypothetical protein